MWEPVIKETESGLLPTPRANSAMTVNLRTQAKHPNPNLEPVIAQMLPTPTTRDWKDGSQYSAGKVPANGLLGRQIHVLCSPMTGNPLYLNPSFVEEMMGFPVGWTA
jgi:hypothetical protein